MSDQSYLSIYAKSFNWAGFFLPKETYLKCSALYDFCRVVDNIADDDDEIESNKKKFLIKVLLSLQTFLLTNLL